MNIKNIINVANELQKRNTNIDINHVDNNSNLIDIDTGINWGLWLSKEQYENFEKALDTVWIKKGNYEIESWCDVSWYDYWVKKQEENNYIMLTIRIKDHISENDINDIDNFIDVFINNY